MAFDEGRITDQLPNSSGGVIEAVKTAVVTAFREGLTGSTMTSSDPTDIHVDMEYPMRRESYPAVWVQFSLTSLETPGLGHIVIDPETGDSLQEFMFQGRVMLTLLALTSIQRDRLADFVISAIAFSRVANTRLITEHGFSDSFTRIYQALDDNPYIAMTVNTDRPNPMGQSVTVGSAWDERQMIYEDAYSFDVIGQFQLVTTNEGYYRLRRIDVLPEVGLGTTPKPGEWI